MAYYDGTKLLSLSDINNKKPELYICTTNRTGGKTTYFNRYVMNRFLKFNEKFGLLFRWNNELDEISDKFFKCIGELFFDEYEMIHKKRAKGAFYELFVGKKGDFENTSVSCGYAFALNSSDKIKKYSHLLSDICRIVFDEFQSETNDYCPNEMTKFISIHTSLARGNGKQVKYLPVFMLSNAVSIINPYFVELGISSRLKADTHFLKGDGFVLENGFIESASTAQTESGFNRAFSNNKYVSYSSQNIYLNDSETFVETVSGRGKYLATIKSNEKSFAILEYQEKGIIYCSDKVDETFPLKISVTTADHNINYVMLKNNDYFIQNMRFYFERGCFRFKNLTCKDAILNLISYR